MFFESAMYVEGRRVWGWVVVWEWAVGWLGPIDTKVTTAV